MSLWIRLRMHASDRERRETGVKQAWLAGGWQGAVVWCHPRAYLQPQPTRMRMSPLMSPGWDLPRGPIPPF